VRLHWKPLAWSKDIISTFSERFRGVADTALGRAIDNFESMQLWVADDDSDKAEEVAGEPIPLQPRPAAEVDFLLTELTKQGCAGMRTTELERLLDRLKTI
jgi:hypothetical protein